jgi:hypothetical protein
LLKVVPAEHLKAATESLARLKEDITPLKAAISTESGSGSGSVQQRDSLDAANAAQETLAKELTVFEELFVPDNFRRNIPEEYANLPALQGRAEVSFILKKPDGSNFDVEGKLYDKVELKMIIDGYNAPITGGNFVDLIDKGFYNNKVITRSDGFVVQMGDADPAGTVHGYVPPGEKEERKVPLELSFKVCAFMGFV